MSYVIDLTPDNLSNSMRFKLARIERGISTKDAAAMLNVSVSVLYSYESSRIAAIPYAVLKNACEQYAKPQK